MFQVFSAFNGLDCDTGHTLMKTWELFRFLLAVPQILSCLLVLSFPI